MASLFFFSAHNLWKPNKVLGQMMKLHNFSPHVDHHAEWRRVCDLAPANATDESVWCHCHNSEFTYKICNINSSSHHSSMLVLWKEHSLPGCQVGQDLYAQFLTCSQFWHFYCGCSRFLLLQLLCQWLNVVRVKSALLWDRRFILSL